MNISATIVTHFNKNVSIHRIAMLHTTAAVSCATLCGKRHRCFITAMHRHLGGHPYQGSADWPGRGQALAVVDLGVVQLGSLDLAAQAVRGSSHHCGRTLSAPRPMVTPISSFYCFPNVLSAYLKLFQGTHTKTCTPKQHVKHLISVHSLTHSTQSYDIALHVA